MTIVGLVWEIYTLFCGVGISYSNICTSNSHLFLFEPFFVIFRGGITVGGGFQAIWVCKIGLVWYIWVVGFYEVFHVVIS